MAHWESAVMRETGVRSLGWEDPLEKGKATHSSILAWRIPGTVSDMTERLSLQCIIKDIACVSIFINEMTGLLRSNSQTI